MSTNEGTFIRTIVKWSKPAAVLATVAVLLVAYVFIQKAHAQEITHVNSMVVKSQQETSKIESNLQEVKSQKNTLEKAVEKKDNKIQQLKEENSELKG